jgi:hypothetical protein
LELRKTLLTFVNQKTKLKQNEMNIKESVSDFLVNYKKEIPNVSDFTFNNLSEKLEVAIQHAIEVLKTGQLECVVHVYDVETTIYINVMGGNNNLAITANYTITKQIGEHTFHLINS